jgi:phosphoribosylanthranilate isomerase
MRVRVKICGVTDEAGVAAALEAGADAVGFVLATSPRQVTPARAAALARALPPFVARVAVFHRPDAAAVDAALHRWSPDLLQLEPEHLDAVPVRWRERVLPVLHDGADLAQRADRLAVGCAARAVHLEGAGRGGRGVPVDRERAAALARRMSLVLAGGLRPDNVAAAVRAVRPFAVDVSSGVETAPGRKDPALVRAFVDEARAALSQPATNQETSR